MSGLFVRSLSGGFVLLCHAARDLAAGSFYNKPTNTGTRASPAFPDHVSDYTMNHPIWTKQYMDSLELTQ